MANQEQLAILGQGVRTWNEWIEEHPKDGIDLSFANLDSVNLSGANLSFARLNFANLSHALQLHFFGGRVL